MRSIKDSGSTPIKRSSCTVSSKAARSSFFVLETLRGCTNTKLPLPLTEQMQPSLQAHDRRVEWYWGLRKATRPSCVPKAFQCLVQANRQGFGVDTHRAPAHKAVVGRGNQRQSWGKTSFRCSICINCTMYVNTVYTELQQPVKRRKGAITRVRFLALEIPRCSMPRRLSACSVGATYLLKQVSPGDLHQPVVPGANWFAL